MTKPVAGDDQAVIRWHEERDTKRLHDVAELLADILDNGTNGTKRPASTPAPNEGDS